MDVVTKRHKSINKGDFTRKAVVTKRRKHKRKVTAEATVIKKKKTVATKVVIGGKALQAQKECKQAQYQEIIKEVNSSIKDGKNRHNFDMFNYHYSNLFSDENIEKLLDEGFDVIYGYNCYSQLASLTVSWENAREGRRGRISEERSEIIPTQKPSFWKRLGNFFELDGDDGTW